MVSLRHYKTTCEVLIQFGDMLNLEIIDAKQTILTEADIRSIVEIESHQRVRKWLYIHVDPDVQKEFKEYRDFLRKLPENKSVDLLVAKSDGNTVGFLALWRLGVYMEHVASIGISVHPDHWGQGVATRLMESSIDLARGKGIRRLEVETLAENASMRHITEKLGFKLEALRKGRVKKDGSYHDETAYALSL